MIRPVLVVIPAWNEATNLPSVIGELRAARGDDALLLVDDASTDATAVVARDLGVWLLRLPVHLGYGGAVQTGIKYSLRGGFPVAVTFDADGQHDPADIAPLVESVRAGADLAVGSRMLLPPSYQGGLLRRVGRRAFSALTRLLTGLPLTDPTSGLKAPGTEGSAPLCASGVPGPVPGCGRTGAGTADPPRHRGEPSAHAFLTEPA